MARKLLSGFADQRIYWVLPYNHFIAMLVDLSIKEWQIRSVQRTVFQIYLTLFVSRFLSFFLSFNLSVKNLCSSCSGQRQHLPANVTCIHGQFLLEFSRITVYGRAWYSGGCQWWRLHVSKTRTGKSTCFPLCHGQLYTGMFNDIHLQLQDTRQSVSQISYGQMLKM